MVTRVPYRVISASGLALAATLVAQVATAQVQAGPLRCKKWNNVACSAADWANTNLKQLVIMPTGYSAQEEATFWSDFDRIIVQMTNDRSGTSNTFSVQHKDKLLFIGDFRPSAPLGENALFKAAAAPHPSDARAPMLVLRNDEVYARVNALRASSLPQLRPFSVGVLFNTLVDATANATPPGYLNMSYGVAKFTRDDALGSWVVTHEIGHSGMNFLDEYTEQGMENISIRLIDLLTPLVVLNPSWRGVLDAIGSLTTVYDIDISEILANNGHDNQTLSRNPQTTGPYINETYAYEGGSFFGRGTFHMKGHNLMNGFAGLRGPDDSFGYTHTPAQQRVVTTAFTGVPGRANNRLRNAGPIDGWPAEFGQRTKVMLFDADKHHQFQKTTKYTVQVGWYEREWKTCWAWIFPYPCSTDKWKTAEKQVTPTVRSVNLRVSFAYGLVSMLQGVVCAVGFTEVKLNGTPYDLCSQSLSEMLEGGYVPSVEFVVPYQEVEVPASQWMTAYWWRFKTSNGRFDSDFTGWSKFFRSF